MKDRAFSGPSVEEAVAAAGRSLGLPPGALRYVVLDPGSPPRLGVSATPARIAVLVVDEGEAGGPVEAARPRPGGDPRAGLRRILQSIAEAGGLDLAIEMETREETFVVRLSGRDRTFFFARQGEVLRAVEHLLQRMFARELAPLHLALECEGYREQRDAEIADWARELAAEVRRDGRPRTTGPLNSYERRIVHVALGGEAGITTCSVGEGGDRQVTVAPAPAGPAPDGTVP